MSKKDNFCPEPDFSVFVASFRKKCVPILHEEVDIDEKDQKKFVQGLQNLSQKSQELEAIYNKLDLRDKLQMTLVLSLAAAILDVLVIFFTQTTDVARYAAYAGIVFLITFIVDGGYLFFQENNHAFDGLSSKSEDLEKDIRNIIVQKLALKVPTTTVSLLLPTLRRELMGAEVMFANNPELFERTNHINEKSSGDDHDDRDAFSDFVDTLNL